MSFNSDANMEDLSFIPELPSGPLEEYRKKCSFDWKLMKLALEGNNIDLLKLKYRLWQALEADPLYKPSPETLPMEAQKRLAQIRVNKIQKTLFGNVHTLSYSKKTRRVMAMNECLHAWDPNVSIKIGLGRFLFSNTLQSLGTERHHRYYDAAWRGEIFACVALTEVAHGSDARLMRTTATYDPAARQFVIHTPDFRAAKCWAGNLGRTCTHAVVFAQLETGGARYGLHAFLVPVRDPSTLRPLPGLTVADLGEKTGVNGIDNGLIMFNQYRVEREALLNRTADVSEGGEYVSGHTEPGRVLGAVLENLLAARIGVIQESCHTISSATAIALRYAATRKQFADDNGEETPLLNYQLHQWRLFGHAAAAVMFRIFIRSLTDTYLDVVERSLAGDHVDSLSEVVSGLHAAVSCAKPLVTWRTLQAVQASREACGGHAYLKCAKLGELRDNHEPAVTYEGDNHVLSQQAGNWLLRRLHAVAEASAPPPLDKVAFLANKTAILASRHARPSYTQPQFVISTYQWLICYLLDETDKQHQRLLSQGLSKLQARSKCQVYRWQDLSIVYAEYLTLQYSLEWIESSGNSLKPVLMKLWTLYGLWSLDKHIVLLYEGEYMRGGESRNLRAAVLELCAELRDEMVGVADALAPTDFVLNSVIGRADGNLYENLEEYVLGRPEALERPSWWREVVYPKAKL